MVPYNDHCMITVRKLYIDLYCIMLLISVASRYTLHAAFSLVLLHIHVHSQTLALILAYSHAVSLIKSFCVITVYNLQNDYIRLCCICICTCNTRGKSFWKNFNSSRDGPINRTETRQGLENSRTPPTMEWWQPPLWPPSRDDRT